LGGWWEEIILTFGILSALDLRQKSKRVDVITDVKGAAADTQKSLGFFML